MISPRCQHYPFSIIESTFHCCQHRHIRLPKTFVILPVPEEQEGRLQDVWPFLSFAWLNRCVESMMSCDIATLIACVWRWKREVQPLAILTINLYHRFDIGRVLVGNLHHRLSESSWYVLMRPSGHQISPTIGIMDPTKQILKGRSQIINMSSKTGDHTGCRFHTCLANHSRRCCRALWTWYSDFVLFCVVDIMCDFMILRGDWRILIMTTALSNQCGNM